ncbi:MAG: GrpB family protein [Chloroflexota bacterium]
MAKKRKIVVVPYDRRWPAMYRSAAGQLASLLGPELISIHHIGSTSIPGLSAKPIIDIMPVVRNINRVDRFDLALIGLGYKPLGENGIPGRRYFFKGGDLNQTHHVHMYEPDNPEVARHLDFRDYLAAHPQQARQYAQLKEQLARQFPYDIDAYIAGKAGFINETIDQAHRGRCTLLP